MKLIKADQAIAPRHPLCHLSQRVLDHLQIGHIAVDAPHEFMEVNAQLAFERNNPKEAIHEEALANPDASPEVDAPWQRRVDQHP